jgi:hypothetical protein
MADTDTSFTPGAAALRVEINGADAGTFTHTAVGSFEAVWKQFSYTFTATTTSTRVAFVNATPSDVYTGLDDVSLTAGTALPGAAGGNDTFFGVDNDNYRGLGGDDVIDGGRGATPSTGTAATT